MYVRSRVASAMYVAHFTAFVDIMHGRSQRNSFRVTAWLTRAVLLLLVIGWLHFSPFSQANHVLFISVFGAHRCYVCGGKVGWYSGQRTASNKLRSKCGITSHNATKAFQVVSGETAILVNL